MSNFTLTVEGFKTWSEAMELETSSPSGIPLPPIGKYMQIKHDREANDGLQRVGYPEVLPMFLNRFCDMTQAYQEWWFKLCIHGYTNYQHWDINRFPADIQKMLRNRWHSLTGDNRAFTNNKGTWTCKDYILPANLGVDCLPGQEPLTCCGNVIQVLGEPLRLAGEVWTPVATLDGRYVPSIELVNRLTQPGLVFVATNVAAHVISGDRFPIVLPDGSYRVDPFPQFAPHDTCVPLVTHGKEAENQERLFKEKGINAPAGTFTENGIRYAVNYIKASRLKSISGKYVPNAYVQ